MPVTSGRFLLLSALLPLIDNALARYIRRKQALQKVDYDDLIQVTHDLLRKRLDAGTQAGRGGLRAILVDEFQDTNAVQSRLIAMLCRRRLASF